eukprot:1150935-Pelagomonas_calceolata.AAC.11
MPCLPASDHHFKRCPGSGPDWCGAPCLYAPGHPAPAAHILVPGSPSCPGVPPGGCPQVPLPRRPIAVLLLCTHGSASTPLAHTYTHTRTHTLLAWHAQTVSAWLVWHKKEACSNKKYAPDKWKGAAVAEGAWGQAGLLVVQAWPTLCMLS